MRLALLDRSLRRSAPPTEAASSLENARTGGSRVNFLGLASYQVLIRIGWIFKTESVIIPAFLDTIAGAGWLRGCLPVLNRVGQSVPPVLVAGRLSRVARKKWALFGYTLTMAVSCLALAGICFVALGHDYSWLPTAFLLLYAIFFACTGITGLAFSTLQGKLIEVTHRGRLMSLSNVIGAPSAILFAWWLLGDWLALPGGGFGLAFSFAGGCFVMAALSAAVLREPRDGLGEGSFAVARQQVPTGGPFRAAWQVVVQDANFRRLAMVVMLFAMVLILFPHYQALARQRLGLSFGNLLTWVIVQNAGTGVFSVVAGPLADFRGNRLVLRVLILANAMTPLVATVLAYLDPAVGRPLFSMVFLLIGLTPVTLKTIINYTLEICRPADHARYLSTINLCLAIPFCLSPFVGWLIDATSFETVFLGGSLLIFTGGLLTGLLVEPRHQTESIEPAPPELATE